MVIKKSAIKKKKSNFMWGQEHKFYGRRCKTTRITKLDAVGKYNIISN
jgi:hypothetical protein